MIHHRSLLSLLFALVAVAAVCQDITICLLALERSSDHISKPFRVGIFVMNWVRRWVFLIALAYTVPVLVLFRGSDALAVCFNSEFSCPALYSRCS
eukprot:COSAG02_NODE_72_length_41961_cov_13.243658_15_plen_96_part_00